MKLSLTRPTIAIFVFLFALVGLFGLVQFAEAQCSDCTLIDSDYGCGPEWAPEYSFDELTGPNADDYYGQCQGPYSPNAPASSCVDGQQWWSCALWEYDNPGSGGGEEPPPDDCSGGTHSWFYPENNCTATLDGVLAHGDTQEFPNETPGYDGGTTFRCDDGIPIQDGPQWCNEVIPGCTNPASTNYDPDATVSDGSCNCPYDDTYTWDGGNCSVTINVTLSDGQARTFYDNTGAYTGSTRWSCDNGNLNGPFGENCDPVPVDCSGSWSSYGSCTPKAGETCGDGNGTRSRTYSINTPASNGGASCPYPDGYVQTQDCDLSACPNPVNGQCSSTPENCIAGNWRSQSDTSTEYRWYCDGTNGGSDDSCSVPIPRDGQCASTANNCSYGSSRDRTDNSTHYLWYCDGTNGGATDSCSEEKPATPVNGQCSSTPENCIAGNWRSQSDTSTEYRWYCDGTNGGSDDSCSAPIPNNSPSANAGPNANLVQPNNSFTVSGASASDSDGTIVSRSWAKISGPSGGSISGGTTLTPTFSNMNDTGTYRFRLTVTDNDGASDSDDMEVSVSSAPITAPTLSFSGSPTTITEGNSSTLSWTVGGTADSCWADGGWSGWKTFSGSDDENVSPTSDTTYTLECWNQGVSSGEESVTITVNSAGSPGLVNGQCASTVNDCNDGSYRYRTDTTTDYRWYCDGENGGSDASCSVSKPATNGQCSSTPENCIAGTWRSQSDTSTEYRWYCDGINGGSNASCSTSIPVTPPTLDITANGKDQILYIRQGENVDVEWDVQSNNVMDCEVTGRGGIIANFTYPGNGATLDANGIDDSEIVNNINNSTTFTLTCDGGYDESATVEVIPTLEEI